MGAVLLVWLLCSVLFTMVASSVNGAFGFVAGVGVSLVFLPFMVALGAVIVS